MSSKASKTELNSDSIASDSSGALWTESEHERGLHKGKDAQLSTAQLAERATKRIRVCRFAVLATIVLIGAAVTVSVYFLLHRYEAQYNASSSISNLPAVYAACVAIAFFVIAISFLVFDYLVSRRTVVLTDVAGRSEAILSSLFPKNVRDRLFEQRAEASNKEPSQTRRGGAPKANLKNYLSGLESDVGTSNFEGKPIADLFPETTILFADIAGFTAWSSEREPAQVFTLLETLYRAFDEMAARRRVYKVETIGDCYVAATGLPDPHKDHAVAMTRFARDCILTMRGLTKELEVKLGPETGDLALRVGVHSGPVTAGVLRGERSRFQLFGDTMNTASRMESNGESGRIHVSQETADLLIAAGKSSWLDPREDKIKAKGKGEMQTYWVSAEKARRRNSSGDLNSASSESDSASELRTPLVVGADKVTRLVEWNADILVQLLKQVVAHRIARNEKPYGSPNWEPISIRGEHGSTVLEEARDIISLPKFDAEAALRLEAQDPVELDQKVVDQLYDFVANIAIMYRDNYFHNFEHASHVCMSVNKLLSRIIAPSDVEYDENAAITGKTLHDRTYGITSDPLTQFACVFSALIHDADHCGVPNAQLIKEGDHLAGYYKGKSIAEQNSVDLAWYLLEEYEYKELLRAICATDEEFKRFRQLVVNAVMATDIVDKDLKVVRDARWENAFSEGASDQPSDMRDVANGRATVVIEHLLQASDVAHTMQHWHVYRKWNKNFFLECHQAWKDGRANKNPADGWYEGEIGFFDFYIIPLAKKLKDCGVFGVSSDEYLNYAMRNRKEWEERGREIVNEMVEKISREDWREVVPTENGYRTA